MKKTELEQKVKDLTAQLTYRYEAASRELEKAGDNLTASAAVLHITGLGGRDIVAPVAIRDGLSLESIAALQRDLHRSYLQAIGKAPKHKEHTS